MEMKMSINLLYLDAESFDNLNFYYTLQMLYHLNLK